MPEDRSLVVDSLRRRPWRTAGIVAGATVLVASGAIVRRHVLREESLNRWTAESLTIARLAQRRGGEWVTSRMGDMRLLATAVGRRPQLLDRSAKPDSATQPAALKASLARSLASLNQLHGYTEIWLFDREGNVAATTATGNPSGALRDAATRSLKADSGIAYGPFPTVGRGLSIALAQKVIDESASGAADSMAGKVIGSAVLVSDATPLLTEIVGWSSQSASETTSLIVRAADSVYAFALTPTVVRGTLLGAWASKQAPRSAQAVFATRPASVARTAGTTITFASRITGTPWAVTRSESVEGVFAKVNGALSTEVSMAGAVFFLIVVIAIARRQADRERKLREIAESEVRYRLLADNATDIIVRHAPDGRIVYISPAVHTILGYHPQQIEGRYPAELFHEDDPTTMAVIVEQLSVTSGTSRAEHRLRHAHGHYVWLETTGRAVRDPVWGTVTELVTVSRDIVARKAAEEEANRAAVALRESNEFVRALFDSSPVAIIATDLELRVVQWNDAAERLFGWTASEAIGQPCPFGPAAMWPELRRSYDAAPAHGRVTDLHSQLCRKDGTIVEVNQSIGVVRDADMRPSGFVLIAADLSEQSRLEAQLRHAQKMDAVGQLAGGVAHDFNNLLTVVTGYAGLLLAELPEGAPMRTDIEEIKGAADRAAVLTRQLLAFSRQQVLQPTILNLNIVVDEMEQMLRRVLPTSIKVITSLDAELGAVNADRGQLEQVLMNLIVNSRDAMPAGGSLTIETMNFTLDAEHGGARADAAVGDYVMLAVSDTGCGMTKAVQSRIFEPFFTTKERGKGTGLGLSTAHGIVTQSGGFLSVYSEPALGTTFTVCLPRVAPVPLPIQATEAAPAVTRGAEVILLVEDDAAVRNTATRILERAGYTVLAASDGHEALGIHERHASRIDLLLTDSVMPEMSGHELVARIRERDPHIAVLVMSGYTEQTSRSHSIVEGGGAFLQKPFTPAGLAAKVRSTINASLAELAH